MRMNGRSHFDTSSISAFLLMWVHENNISKNVRIYKHTLAHSHTHTNTRTHNTMSFTHSTIHSVLDTINGNGIAKGAHTKAESNTNQSTILFWVQEQQQQQNLSFPLQLRLGRKGSTIVIINSESCCNVILLFLLTELCAEKAISEKNHHSSRNWFRFIFDRQLSIDLDIDNDKTFTISFRSDAFSVVRMSFNWFGLWKCAPSRKKHRTRFSWFQHYTVPPNQFKSVEQING